MSKLALWVGLRVVGSETHFHYSHGQVKDGKYLPVIPITVPAHGSPAVQIKLIFAALPRPMTKLDAVKAMQKMADFKDHVVFLKAEEARQVAKEADEIKAAQDLIAAVATRDAEAKAAQKTQPKA